MHSLRELRLHTLQTMRATPTDNRHLEKALEARLGTIQDRSRAMTREAWECAHTQVFVHVGVVELVVIQAFAVQLVVASVIG